MKRLFLSFSLLVVLAAPKLMHSSIFNLFSVKNITEDKAAKSEIDNAIELLKKKKKDIEVFGANYKKDEIVYNDLIVQVTQKIQHNIDDQNISLLQKKISILAQINQVLSEINQVIFQILSIIDENLILLEAYKADPFFQSKAVVGQKKSAYSLEDFQKLSENKFYCETELKSSSDKLSRLSIDLENRKKSLSSLKQEYEDKKSENGSSLPVEILELTEKLLKFKKDLAELRVKEIDQKQILTERQIKVAEEECKAISSKYFEVKTNLRVDESDLAKSEALLQNQITESGQKQQEYKQKIEEFEVLKSKTESDLFELKQKSKLSDTNFQDVKDFLFLCHSIDCWSENLKIAKLSVGGLSKITGLIAELAAKIYFEKSKIKSKEVNNFIVNAWYKINSSKFDFMSKEEKNRLINDCNNLKNDIEDIISAVSEKNAQENQSLNSNYKTIENIKERIRDLKIQKNTTFQGFSSAFNKFSEILKISLEEDMKFRTESTAQLLETYALIVNSLKSLVSKLEIVGKELEERKNKINRIPNFIKSLKSIFPEVKRFVKVAFSKASLEKSFEDIKEIDLVGRLKQPVILLNLFAYLFLALIIYLLLRLYLPDIESLLLLVGPENKYFYWVCHFSAMIFGFFSRNLFPIFFWFVIFGLQKFQVFVNFHFALFFYTFSIIFFISYVFTFLKNFKKTNEKYDNLFIREENVNKSIVILGVMLCSTVLLMFIRESFLLVEDSLAIVPNSLLAINFIIIQTCALLLIQKSSLIKFIPNSNPVFISIKEHFDKYYYFYLTGIIIVLIMSNPYLGYGSYFLKIIWQVILILLLIPCLSALHGYVKKSAKVIFFKYDGEAIIERFQYGRTIYGLILITSFIFFSLFAGLFIGKILGFDVDINRIKAFTMEEIYSFTNAGGHLVIVNFVSIFKLVLYLFAGIITVVIFNRFVLRKIFDILLVSTGIQNALLSLSRYIIILVFMVIGLKRIGLESTLIYVFAVIGGLGVAGKELITDFIGYFIILIQRPIKIGDLVRIDDDIPGVVRQITLRSVIIRKKNSVTVIIPNSHVVNKPIINWNHHRTFFAFEDIQLTVPYSCDPTKVREIILIVLRANLNILKNPAPIVQLREFTDNGFQFMVRGFLSPEKVLDQWEIASDIRLQLVSSLRQENISVASPTRIIKILTENVEH